MGKLEGIRIQGYGGKWHEIDRALTLDGEWVLFEHDHWGDEANFLLVSVVGDMIVGEVYETFDGIAQTVHDYDLKVGA